MWPWVTVRTVSAPSRCSRRLHQDCWANIWAKSKGKMMPSSKCSRRIPYHFLAFFTHMVVYTVYINPPLWPSLTARTVSAPSRCSRWLHQESWANIWAKSIGKMMPSSKCSRKIPYHFLAVFTHMVVSNNRVLSKLPTFPPWNDTTCSLGIQLPLQMQKEGLTLLPKYGSW